VATLVALFGMQVAIALMLGVYFTPHLAGYALFVPWVLYYQNARATLRLEGKPS
jgi:hypothetical protein